VFILGDFIQHDFNIDDKIGMTKELKYEIISAMWSNLTQMVSTNFPDTPIIAALGNNDNFENYIPPGSI